MPAYQGTPRICADKPAVKAFAGEPTCATGLQSAGYAGKSKLFGSCFSPKFEQEHLGQAVLVGFGPQKDQVARGTYNKVLVPHIEEAFRRIKALNLPYQLRTVNGYQFRYAKTDKNKAALMGRSEYTSLRGRPNWSGSWNTLCAQLDLQENRFDEMVPERHLPKRDILSNHSYGSAFDLNVRENPFDSKLPFDLPIEIVRLLENMGFYWGGRYHDYMHFEWVDPRPPAGSAIHVNSGVKWPLGAEAGPQSYVKYFGLNETGKSGYFPIGTAQNIHGGIHLDPFAPSKLADGTLVQPAWKSGTCPVSSFLPGYVVAARCFPEEGSEDPRLLEATEGRPLGFVLVRHELREPPPKSGKDKDKDKDKDEKAKASEPNAVPTKVFYSLYMHLDPPASAASLKTTQGVSWLDTLLGMQHGCLVNLDPSARGLGIGDVRWLDQPASADAPEVVVRGEKEPVTLVGSEGQRLGFVKACPEEVREAVGAFRRGAVVTFDAPLLPVGTGHILGTISPTNGAGYLHWEVFCVKDGASALDTIAKKAADELGLQLREVSENIPDNFIDMPDETGEGVNELKAIFGNRGLAVEDMTDERYSGALRRYMLDPGRFGPGSKVGSHGGATYPVTIQIGHDSSVPPKANPDGSPFKLQVRYLRGEQELYEQTVSLGQADTMLSLDVPVEADSLALWSADLYLDSPSIPEDRVEAHEKEQFQERKQHLAQVLQGRYRNVILSHTNEWTPEGLKAQLDKRMQKGKLGNVLRLGDADLEALVKVFRPITWWGRVRSEGDPAGEVPLLGKNGKVETLFGTQAEHHQLPTDAHVQCMHPVTCAAITEMLLERSQVAFSDSWGPVPLRAAEDVSKPPLLALVWSGKKNALGGKVTAVLVQHGFGSSGKDEKNAVTFKLERMDKDGAVDLGVATYDEGIARAEAYFDWWGTWRLTAWEAGKQLTPAQELDTTVTIPKPDILPDSMEWHPVEGQPGHYNVNMVVKGSRPAQLKGYVVLDYAKVPADSTEPPTEFTPGNVAVPISFQTTDADTERVSGGLRYRGDFLVGRVKAKENPRVSEHFRFEDFIRVKGTGQRVFEGEESKFQLAIPLIDRLQQLSGLCQRQRLGIRVSSVAEDGASVVVRPTLPALFSALASLAQELPSSELSSVHIDEESHCLLVKYLLKTTDSVPTASVHLSLGLGLLCEEKLDASGVNLQVRPLSVFPNGGFFAFAPEQGAGRCTFQDIERPVANDCIVQETNCRIPQLQLFEFGPMDLSFAETSLRAEVELMGDEQLWRLAKPIFRLELSGREVTGGSLMKNRLLHEWPISTKLQDKHALNVSPGETFYVTAEVSAKGGLAAMPPSKQTSMKLEPRLESWAYEVAGKWLILRGVATATPRGHRVEVIACVEDSSGLWVDAAVSVMAPVDKQKNYVLGEKGLFVAKVALASLDRNRRYRFSWGLPLEAPLTSQRHSVIVDLKNVGTMR
ncbi:MAG: M15 family metallopeptidase [Myxococcales bacterium]|nr:M15 family metallopeptidase [Myxococcales bacterium]